MLSAPIVRSLYASLALACLLGSIAAADQSNSEPIPLSTVPASSGYAESLYPKPLSFPQQQARFQAEQRMMRMEMNKWIGYEPLRPTVSANYIFHMYRSPVDGYSPYRGRFISNGFGPSSWFW